MKIRTFQNKKPRAASAKGGHMWENIIIVWGTMMVLGVLVWIADSIMYPLNLVCWIARKHQTRLLSVCIMKAGRSASFARTRK